MNQNQIQQLTAHLSQALDQNYDVVNMDAVMSVICTLEGTTITKEQLEATRLAKYINQLRRRTKNDQLARRAKSLLKKWREMVGIHQAAANDSQPPPTQFKQHMIGRNSKSELNIVDTEVNQNNSQLCSSPLLHQVITDLHSNIDSTETSHSSSIQSGVQQQNHSKNFSRLLNHQTTNNNIDNNKGESSLAVSKSTIRNPRKTIEEPPQVKPAAVINEQSINISVGNKTFNDASIVIDIVSDSDENDSVNNSSQQNSTVTTFSSQPLPAFNPTPTKKSKKDKKRKEKEKLVFNNTKEETCQQHLRGTNRINLLQIDERTPKTYSADSEILSLSNSSMSSIISVDTISGNSQNNRLRNTGDNLTFAGRFKSINQLDALRINIDDNAVHINGQKASMRANETNVVNFEQQQEPSSTRPKYDDYVNNDSSTSLSRLSPFEHLEAKYLQQPQSQHFEGSKQLMLSISSTQPQNESNNKMEYQVPKKRGRKKGSKGVDSVIAKESSLSQHIFFGSGVKKVKTTKELFNDIQSRKPSISFRGDSLPATSKIPNVNYTIQNRESRSLLTRPTSSCSETSLHSPQTLEAFSTNESLVENEKLSKTIEVSGNTDSDTITSEPSRDSMKSPGYKTIMKSSDSNSYSIQNSTAKHASDGSKSTTSYNDVTTQLMHLVRSFYSPLNVSDAEKLYQSQIVPCTCTILEDIPNQQPIDSSDKSEINNEINDGLSHLDRLTEGGHNNNDTHFKINYVNCKESTPPSLFTTQKPVKSIFDLDFDDDDDPLHSIMQNIPPENLNLISHENSSKNNVKLLSSPSSETDMKAISDNNMKADPEVAANTLLEPHSIYTVHEDPNCLAKKRFDLQTNDITNFHINALHNYYVPNINGNWNLIETYKNTSEFVQTLELYQVSDGADVVPKYGSLTYELIRKDLSCLTFTGSLRKTKPFKSIIPTFLGVAKCLPTCRQAAVKRREKRDVKLFSSVERMPDLNPLEVVIHHHHHNNNNDDQMSLKYSEKNAHTNLGYNLLKLVNNKIDDPDKSQSEQTAKIRQNIGPDSSNSIVRPAKHSIYETLRNQAFKFSSDQEKCKVVQRNRKKRRKINNEHNLIDDKKQRIKRIKFAINGNVSSVRQLPGNTDDDVEIEEENVEEALSDFSNESNEYYQHYSTSEDEYELESYRSQSTATIDEDGQMENEYDYSNDNEYAIVQRPMLNDGSNNHIVLTIKKTPSKINSPVSSVSPKVNTSMSSKYEIDENTIEMNKTYLHTTEPNIIIGKMLSLESNTETDSTKLKPNTCQINIHRCYRYRRRRRFRYCRPLDSKIDITLKHLFNNVRQDTTTQTKMKTHQKIFFANELNRVDSSGRTERIVNYSSDDDEDFEMDEGDISLSSLDENQQSNYGKFRNKTDESASVMNNNDQQQEVNDNDNEYTYLLSEDENDGDNENKKDNTIIDTQIELINLHNNGMLPTFDAIYTDQKESSLKLPQRQSNTIGCIVNSDGKSDLIEKCEPFTCSQRNNNILSSPELTQPAIEYKTGIREIMDNTHPPINEKRVQQFKEWHQVLQLQSYNDEPLIVLPYVVLE